MSIPNSHACPLTHNLMTDPVIDRQGHTFDRESVTEWLQSHTTCPVGGEPLAAGDLCPNRALKEVVDQYAADHPEVVVEQLQSALAKTREAEQALATKAVVLEGRLKRARSEADWHRRRKERIIQIFVKNLGGKTITCDVRSDNTIADIKAMIQSKERIPARDQLLLWSGGILLDDSTVAENHLQSNSTLHLKMRVLPCRGCGSDRRLTIKNVLTGETFVSEARSCNSVSCLKNKMEDLTGMPAAKQRLYFADQRLDDAKNLADYLIPSEATILLF
eukprot:TRINITY_DN14659_c0_g1_i1.p1 TRINITY_DN14659_c0_g1~~TRINITY_DN14659_c0_g1_i1.p1  ORF type:complete len:286 (-),score=46.10 TRINITY_DN14659_c0_g1_i1:180-1007(-)